MEGSSTAGRRKRTSALLVQTNAPATTKRPKAVKPEVAKRKTTKSQSKPSVRNASTISDIWNGFGDDLYSKLEFVHRIGLLRVQNLLSLVQTPNLEEKEHSTFDELETRVIASKSLSFKSHQMLQEMNDVWTKPSTCVPRSMMGDELKGIVERFGHGGWTIDQAKSIAQLLRGVNCFDLRDYGNTFYDFRLAWQTYVTANPVLHKFCDPEVIVLAFGAGALTGALPGAAAYAGHVAAQVARFGMAPVAGSDFVFAHPGGAAATGFGGAMQPYSARFFHFPGLGAPPALV